MTLEPLYHVVLEGRRVGPYDRRTIVGMRIKKTLANEHVLVDASGFELTVGDLIAHRRRNSDFSPQRTGSFSIVQATYTASLVRAERGAFEVLPLRGEVEVRVQGDVLRIAGRWRRGWRWHEDRFKLPLSEVAHARLRGSQLDLWLRGPGGALQQVVLELFSPDSAGELAEFLPRAKPWPGPPAASGTARNALVLWLPWASMVLVACVLLGVLFLRR